MVRIENLQVEYQKNQPILSNVTMNVAQGERLVILGPSGCGKSTLLKIISGLNKDFSGSVKVETDHPSYVFQEDRLLPWLSAKENVLLVNNDADVESIFNELGLSGNDDKKPDELSGGMRQRLQIARALAFSSSLMLMDEPFTSLDYMLKWKLIHHLNAVVTDHDLTLMYVTHDIDEALMIATRILLMGHHPNNLRGEYVIDVPHEQRNLELSSLGELRQRIIHDMEVE